MIDMRVELGERGYDIRIGAGAFESAMREFDAIKSNGRKLFCVADPAVLREHPQKAEEIKKRAQIIEVFGGEGSKCFDRLAQICSLLASGNADRKSVLIALGGGVVGDLTGFAASCYMRGIEFYQLPTTLLAMVDSSVGGKTGINIPEGKNLVGAFHQPSGVFADTDFLATLPPREFSAGMAEVIKCGILGDVGLFEFLENLPRPLEPKDKGLDEAIRMSCQLKADVVAADERETAASGGRALLNLGHTFGHAIENSAGYGHYLHGEAVGLGMMMAADLSKSLGLIGDAEIKRIEKIVRDYSLPVKLREPISAERMMAAMTHDKKSACGRLKFVLINAVGKSSTSEVDMGLVERTLAKF